KFFGLHEVCYSIDSKIIGHDREKVRNIKKQLESQPPLLKVNSMFSIFIIKVKYELKEDFGQSYLIDIYASLERLFKKVKKINLLCFNIGEPFYLAENDFLKVVLSVTKISAVGDDVYSRILTKNDVVIIKNKLIHILLEDEFINQAGEFEVLSIIETIYN
ncbi:MAG: hypothetical protein LBM99_02395, partial [Bacillales bacterium]|nr:hypothetical protein [Bacillales bacterium]